MIEILLLGFMNPDIDNFIEDLCLIAGRWGYEI
jgi:hypothetical protein